MKRLLMTGAATAAWLCGTGSALAQEVVVQNDSFGGGAAVVFGDFIGGEEGGVRLTMPCDGVLVGVQIAWFADFPEAPTTLEQAIHIYDGSTFPGPGSELQELLGPVMTPGFLNEFRWLDQAMTLPLAVPVTDGQKITITLELFNDTDVLGGSASFIRDIDGCLAGENVLFAIPGGWLEFCGILDGDIVIRAIVDCGAGEGACCLPEGGCFEGLESICDANEGVFQGNGTVCGDIECPQPDEACCFEGAGCLDLAPSVCMGAGGTPQGPGSECGIKGTCETTGACCLPDGTCADDMAESDCLKQNGAFQGLGVQCVDVEAEGACCFDTGFCIELSEEECLKAGATWVFCADCTDADENGTADACEDDGVPGDLDGDGDVDAADLAALLGVWGPCPGCPEDLNGDNVVDAADLAVLLGNWG